MNAACPVRTSPEDWLFDLDCEPLVWAECLAAEATAQTRQKIVQIRICVLRNLYMAPLGIVLSTNKLALSVKDAEREGGESSKMRANGERPPMNFVPQPRKKKTRTGDPFWQLS